MWKYHGLFYWKMYHKTVDARLIVNCAIVPQMGHSAHNNTEHFLWSQVGKWAIMGQKLIYYHIGTQTYMLNDVSKHPRPLKIMLNHIFKNQCHKPRNKKNTFLVSHLYLLKLHTHVITVSS